MTLLYVVLTIAVLVNAASIFIEDGRTGLAAVRFAVSLLGLAMILLAREGK